MEEKGINYSYMIEQAVIREFWDKRWRENNTGWDLGQASPAIAEYMKSYQNKTAAILIAGCGNAYEAEFLIQNGFKDITLLDISPTQTGRLKEKFKNNPEIKIICHDFFTFHGSFDLMIEQTFFCAIDRNRREQYAEKAHEFLNPGGQIIGLLFNKEFEKDGPPFGGTKNEYETVFSPYFNIKKMETTTNSIQPRMGNEFFIILNKK